MEDVRAGDEHFRVESFRERYSTGIEKVNRRREESNRATGKKRGIQEVLKFKEMLLEKEDVDDGFENENRNRDNDGEEDGQQNQRQDDSLPEAGPRSCLDNLSYVLSSRAKDIAFDQRQALACRSTRVFSLRREGNAAQSGRA